MLVTYVIKKSRWRDEKNKIKRLRVSAPILTLIILTGLLITPVLGATINSDDDNLSDELLIKFKPGVSEQYKERFLNSLGLEIKDEIPQTQTFIVSAPQEALQYIKSALLCNPLIDSVEEDHIISPLIIPNDEYYSSEWHLNKILASEAWDISTGDSNVVIAVLDSGVDPNHPDLSTKLLQGYNFYDNNYNTTDVYGHGTKVAGVAAALTNNTIGVSSISWQCSIMPLRVTDTNGYTSYSLLVKALIYAADRGAKVAVISFGIFGGSALSDAAKYFMDKGGLVVVAGGNDNANHSDPDNPYIISVSATTSSDSKASFSSYGPYIDLSAPGVGIYTTIRGGSYGSVSGTSFSAPLTAGLIALIFSANPSLTPTQVEQIIESTTIDLGDQGYDYYYGWGRIDASKALREAVGETLTLYSYNDLTPPNVAITYPLDGTTVSGGINVSVDASDDNGILKVELYKDGTLYSTDSEAPFSFYWDTTSESDSLHTLMARAYDTSDNIKDSSTVNVIVSNLNSDNAPPIVSIIRPKDGSKVSRSIKISASASDESGISKVEFYIDGSLIGTDYSYSYYCYWNTKSVSNGWHIIMVRAYDNFGNYADASIRVYVSNRVR
ncbi:MAG: S8 family serine peptidase [archaeon]|nr:S8 family serine peptidase [archaeon]